MHLVTTVLFAAMTQINLQYHSFKEAVQVTGYRNMSSSDTIDIGWSG